MAGQQKRVALVTGAASGIGAAIATRLHADGLDILAVDLRPAPDGPGTAFRADLTTREGNRAAVDAALEQFGRLDVVVANAGFQHVSPIATFPEDRWDALLAILLTSPFLLAKYAWPALVDSGAGRFLAIASAHALVASPFKAGYVSAKHGVLGLVKTLALEGAAVGVTATALCPAYVRTPLVEKQISAQAVAHHLPEERVLEEVILAPQAVKRLVEPDEVAAMAAFLVGQYGGSITGVAIPMDQGWTARLRPRPPAPPPFGRACPRWPAHPASSTRGSGPSSRCTARSCAAPPTTTARCSPAPPRRGTSSPTSWNGRRPSPRAPPLRGRHRMRSSPNGPSRGFATSAHPARRRRRSRSCCCHRKPGTTPASSTTRQGSPRCRPP